MDRSYTRVVAVCLCVPLINAMNQRGIGCGKLNPYSSLKIACLFPNDVQWIFQLNKALCTSQLKVALE